MAIKDISFFNSNVEDNTITFEGTDAISIAIRNILLSETGVFVNDPSLNLDVSNILFDQIGDDDISSLKNTIYSELVKKIPNLSGIVLDVKKLKIDNDKVDGSTAIGISILKPELENSQEIIMFKSGGTVVVI